MNGGHRPLSHFRSSRLCEAHDNTGGTPCPSLCVFLPPNPLCWTLALFTALPACSFILFLLYWIRLLSLQKFSALLWPKITFHLWCPLEFPFYSSLFSIANICISLSAFWLVELPPLPAPCLSSQNPGQSLPYLSPALGQTYFFTQFSIHFWISRNTAVSMGPCETWGHLLI